MKGEVKTELEALCYHSYGCMQTFATMLVQSVKGYNSPHGLTLDLEYSARRDKGKDQHVVVRLPKRNLERRSSDNRGQDLRRLKYEDNKFLKSIDHPPPSTPQLSSYARFLIYYFCGYGIFTKPDGESAFKEGGVQSDVLESEFEANGGKDTYDHQITDILLIFPQLHGESSKPSLQFCSPTVRAVFRKHSPIGLMLMHEEIDAGRELSYFHGCGGWCRFGYGSGSHGKEGERVALMCVKEYIVVLDIG
ncbi:uncharacterized protein BDR25DRAFT_356719 [Lindgomyces ingoldianus]|uniref:Uncharacterized protein n=1 Tax=Lindgomyces ingoldianus TaxID=673940 RepID=A0ACB6QR86_9PLEO|nr:uncharacterized protein BDR25DRAFT_356719 [Lindgomyces ingoldianus]KAF2469499.1 hypothetical protein BDR25DRAFT_356719 [Lindgomyces ingoldianus]